MTITKSSDYDPKDDRTRVLEALYEALRDDTDSQVYGAELRDELGLTDDRAANALHYLEDKGLVKAAWTMGDRTPLYVKIRHRGIEAMEAAKEHPARSAREGMSPYGNVVNHITIQNNTNSPLQIGNVSSTQTNAITSNDIGKLREFVAQVESRIPLLRLEIDDETVESLAADTALVKAQLEAPTRRDHVIRACLGSIKATLEGAAGNVVAAGLLAMLPHIHL